MLKYMNEENTVKIRHMHKTFWPFLHVIRYDCSFRSLVVRFLDTISIEILLTSIISNIPTFSFIKKNAFWTGSLESFPWVNDGSCVYCLYKRVGFRDSYLVAPVRKPGNKCWITLSAHFKSQPRSELAIHVRKELAILVRKE